MNFETICYLFCLIGLSYKSFYEFKECKKIVKKSKERQSRTEIILENLADTHMIYDYFMETKKRLPEPLHNIMLSHCLNDDFYAIKYIRSI
jgi:hypothetical protein